MPNRRHLLAIVAWAMAALAPRGAGATDWRDIPPSQSYVLVDADAIGMSRKLDGLLELAGYGGFMNHVRLEDAGGRAFLELVYGHAHPTHYLFNAVDVAEYVKTWHYLRNKTPALRGPTRTRNAIGDVEAITAAVDNRDCVVFRQYWQTSTHERHSGSDQGSRTMRNLIGLYCGPVGRPIGDNEFCNLVMNIGIKPGS